MDGVSYKGSTARPGPRVKARRGFILLAVSFSTLSVLNTQAGGGDLDQVISSEQIESKLALVSGPIKTKGLRHSTFGSRTIGEDVSYHIYLPESYDKEPNRSYPVIYWLHGAGDVSAETESLVDFFRDAMARGQMPDAIIVFPNSLGSVLWCDSFDGQVPTETVFVRDLISHIDSKYRTKRGRPHRVLGGFGEGAYGAGRIAFKHLDKFKGAVMYGARPMGNNFFEGVAPGREMRRRQRLFSQIYGGNQDYYEDCSPSSLAENTKNWIPIDFGMRVVVGENDPGKWENSEFNRQLKALGFRHHYREISDAGHSFSDLLSADQKRAADFYSKMLSAK